MLARKSSLEIMRCVLINQFITTVICIYKYLYYYNNIIIIHVAYNRWISVSKVNKKSRLFPNSLIHIKLCFIFSRAWIMMFVKTICISWRKGRNL